MKIKYKTSIFNYRYILYLALASIGFLSCQKNDPLIFFPSEAKSLGYNKVSELNDNFNDADILYMTRVQKERFQDLMEYERVKNVYTLQNEMLEHTRPNLRILHPLPRVNEISMDVDKNEKAYYFQQAQNGLYVRQAILSKVLLP